MVAWKFLLPYFQNDLEIGKRNLKQVCAECGSDKICELIEPDHCMAKLPIDDNYYYFKCTQCKLHVHVCISHLK